MNATEPVKTRFKTLTAALEEIERLEKQVIALNAALAASKTVAPTKAQTSIPPTAPAVSQPPAAATPPPVERPLAELSKRALADAIDLANAQGDKAAVERMWAEYSSR